MKTRSCDEKCIYDTYAFSFIFFLRDKIFPLVEFMMMAMSYYNLVNKLWYVESVIHIELLAVSKDFLIVPHLKEKFCTLVFWSDSQSIIIWFSNLPTAPRKFQNIVTKCIFSFDQHIHWSICIFTGLKTRQSYIHTRFGAVGLILLSLSNHVYFNSSADLYQEGYFPSFVMYYILLFGFYLLTNNILFNF